MVSPTRLPFTDSQLEQVAQAFTEKQPVWGDKYLPTLLQYLVNGAASHMTDDREFDFLTDKLRDIGVTQAVIRDMSIELNNARFKKMTSLMANLLKWSDKFNDAEEHQKLIEDVCVPVLKMGQDAAKLVIDARLDALPRLLSDAEQDRFNTSAKRRLDYSVLISAVNSVLNGLDSPKASDDAKDRSLRRWSKLQSYLDDCWNVALKKISKKVDVLYNLDMVARECLDELRDLGVLDGDDEKYFEPGWELVALFEGRG